MGKPIKLVVCGPSGVGKTSLIDQCIYGNHAEKVQEDFIPTIEDTYNAVVETDRGSKERVRIYDIGGKTRIERHFINCADAFIIVYDTSNARTLDAAQKLKADLSSVKPQSTIDRQFVRSSRGSYHAWPIHKEPAYILLPKRSSTAGYQPPGPCTSLQVISDTASGDCRFASGHLNGWILLWSLLKRRTSQQWLGHPNAQVSGLRYWCNNKILISQGRDGFIRFWTIPDKSFTSGSVPEQALPELQTCSYTFCSIDFWPFTHSSAEDPLIPPVYYLAHIPDENSEGESEGSTKTSQPHDVEVVQFPENVITVHTSMMLPDENNTGFSKLGMCMAIQGISQSSSLQLHTHRCVFLAAYEAGHLFLYGDGIVLSRLDNCLGPACPIMSLGLYNHCSNGPTIATAVLGGPQAETLDAEAVDTCCIQVLFENDKMILHADKKANRLGASGDGVSSFAWRSDGRILALGQWDGKLRIVQFARGRPLGSLGCLTAPGGLGEGELLGDWASTTVTQPHGPLVDQKSTVMRCCMFTTQSNWLITTSPANAGADGSLLVWDIHRTRE